MILVLGLGNPGDLYAHTRHNAGVDALEKTAAFFQTELRKRCFRLYAYCKVPGAQLVFPHTYMNNSGRVMKYFKHINPSQIVVICDNMDLAVGGLRIRKGGGSSGQKGLDSIAKYLGSADFVRIYVGIGRPEEGVRVADHVLGVEKNPVKAKAYEEALEDASKAVVKFIQGSSVEELQCEFNRKGLL